MQLLILVKEWKVKLKDDKSKTIAGEYAVMCGPNEVAASGFNDGYNNTDIQIPAELLAEAEVLDSKIKHAIIENFAGKQELDIETK